MADNEQAPGSNQVSLTDYEAEQTQSALPPTPGEIKLDGDAIPEEYRGKTVADIIARAKATESALRISEDARLSLSQSAQNRQDAPPSQQQEPEVPNITREQIQELYEKDPIEAMELVNNLAIARAEKHMNNRFGQLVSSVSDTTENWAKQEFADEFKVLGKEIEEFRRSLPDQRVFTSKKGWEDLVSYVRGQRGNYEKLMDYKQGGRQPQRTLELARTEQDMDSGFAPAPRRSSVPVAAGNMDVTEKKIMNEFIDSGTFKDENEYLRWKSMGAR